MTSERLVPLPTTQRVPPLPTTGRVPPSPTTGRVVPQPTTQRLVPLPAAEQTALITSDDPLHPANHICTLCKAFYSLGWVTGTGGGTSIRQGPHIFIAPSGVQKELMQPDNIFVMDYETGDYLRRPPVLKPSACTPLFLAAFADGAGCCIHTHSQWAVLVTLLVERDAKEAGQLVSDRCFEIEEIEQIKGIPRGKGKEGMLGYHDRLKIPIIKNTAQ